MNKILCYFGFHKWLSISKNLPTKKTIPYEFIEDDVKRMFRQMSGGFLWEFYTYKCKCCNYEERICKKYSYNGITKIKITE